MVKSYPFSLLQQHPTIESSYYLINGSFQLYVYAYIINPYDLTKPRKQVVAGNVCSINDVYNTT